MKPAPKILFLFSFFYCENGSAQYIPPVTKTSLNKFIEDDRIQWAAYTNDTAGLPALTALLMQQVIEKKITGYAPVENGVGAEDSMQQRSPDELSNMFEGAVDPIPRFDPAGNPMPDEDKDRLKIDLQAQAKNTGIEFYQILYVEKNKLRSYITRVSLNKQLITPAGTDLGRVEYGSFCINKKYDAQIRRKDKIIFLGKITQSYYTDSVPEFNKLKQLYGRDLIATITSAVKSGKLNIYPYNSNEKITAAQLMSGDFPEADRIEIPFYDSTGRPAPSKSIRGFINFTYFKKAVITEEFYYDQRKNIVLCKIPELVLFKYTENRDRGLVPSLRIIF